MNTDNPWSKQEACFAHVNQVWLAVNHNTSDLHGQVSLAAVNNINVFHEVINGYTNLRIH